MRYLLIYDIVHDGIRTKVADACLDYGLERIQYSAFLGTLTSVHQRELWLQIQHRIGKHTAIVHLYPLNEKSWAGLRVLEQRAQEKEDVVDG